MRIGRLIKGSLLERSGQVHEGDEVLEVNGIEMHDKHIDDAARIIVRAALLCSVQSTSALVSAFGSIMIYRKSRTRNIPSCRYCIIFYYLKMSN